MSSPAPSHQPPLGGWGHTWRTLLCLLISAPTLLNVVVNDGQPPRLGLPVELAVATLAWVLMYLRRRWPVPVALICVLCGIVSSAALGPAVLTLVSLATWRRPVPLVAVASTAVLGSTAWGLVLDEGERAWWWGLLLTAGYVSIASGWGLYLGSRRALIASLRERAQRAEAEQRWREEHVRAQERARIAREMHDVVAHQISQVALRAGAMAYRTDLAAETMREGSAVIQQSAHQALQELRGVLGVLRGPEIDDEPPASGAGAGSPAAPQPVYADIATLVDRSRESETAVELVQQVSATVPDELGRALYRLVQEGLTNAAKHAVGAPVRVRLGGGPGPGIELVVSNPASDAVTAPVPGSGWGLVGMAERVQLLDGRLEHGWQHDHFVLRAWVPWPG